MSFSLHSRRFRVSLGPESSLLVTTVALSALWVLEFSAPRHVWPRLVIATVALLATWKGLRRGLEPFLLELRPNYDTLHSLAALAALLLSFLSWALAAFGRLPENLTTSHGVPVLFLDSALLAMACQVAGRHPAWRLRQEDPTPPSADLAAGTVLALGAAAFAATMWLLLGSAPAAAAYAGTAILIVTDPFLCARLRRITLERLSDSLESRGVRLPTMDLIHAAARVNMVVFQRRGVLTDGLPRISEVVPLAEDRRPEDVVRMAAAAEFGAQHPLSDGILGNATLKTATIPNVKGFEDIPSRGVRAFLQGREVLCGNRQLLVEQGLPSRAIAELDKRSEELRKAGDTVLYLALSREVIGLISLRDTLRPETVSALDELRGAGVRVGVLSGDDRVSVNGFCRQLGPVETFEDVAPEGTRRASGISGRRAIVATRLSHGAALERADVAIEWVPAGEAGPKVLPPNRAVVETRDLRVVPRILKAGRSFQRHIRRQRAGILFYQAVAWSLVGGVLYPFLPWTPTPLLAAALFLLTRKLTCKARRRVPLP